MYGRETTKRSLLMGIAVGLALVVAAPAFGDAIPKTVANKVYSVNVQTSFGTTFTDCFRFTASTLEVDGCGDSGPFTEQALFGTTFVTGWGAHVPCTGLDIIWFGTATDGTGFPGGQGGDVIGGTAIGLTQGTTFSVNGIASAVCPASSVRNGLNYTRPNLK